MSPLPTNTTERVLREPDRATKAPESAWVPTLEAILGALDRVSPLGVVVCDPGGRVVRANPAAARLLATEPSALLGLTWEDPRWRFTDAQGRALEGPELPWARALAGETLEQAVKITLTGPGGDPVPLAVTGCPLAEVGGALFCIGDLGPQEEARRQRDETQAAAGMGDWAITLTDGSVRWSPGVRRVLGLDPAHRPDHGMSILDQVRPERRQEAISSLLGAVSSRAPFTLELPMILPDGRERWVVCQGRAVGPDQGPATGLVGTIRDRTEQINLEQTLGTRTQELEAAKGDLQSLAHAIGHDLEEPLDAMSGYLGILERRFAHQLEGQAREFMDLALEAGRRMRRMIQGILEYARVTSRGRDPVATDSAQVLRSVLRDLEPQLSMADMRVSTGRLPMVMADVTQLARVFTNLVRNSIKFRTRHNPRLVVEARRDGDMVEFMVSDNGVGFDDSLLDRVFGMFQRLHTEAEYPGEGIGLALCKRVVERHGGRIWARSRPGEGTQVFFTLPVAKQGGFIDNFSSGN